MVLAGGGSLVLGMADAPSKAIGCNVIHVGDPVMSSAVGFEAKAAGLAVLTAKNPKGRPNRPSPG